MKILAPVNKSEEVKAVIQAGADEIYCGLMEEKWLKNYTNVASPNRREWSSANLNSLEQLQMVADIAHENKTRVYLAMNALYSQSQYSFVMKQVDAALKMGIDAFIVADLGLLLSLKKQNIRCEIHISTGGTTFNSQTAAFYQDLGAQRIVLPRHLQIREMQPIIKDCPGLKFEAFILNSGCKNIDGFCTFHHGINEVLHGRLWNIPKKLNFDRWILNMVRRLPKGLSQRIKTDIFGIDSACLLSYKASFLKEPALKSCQEREKILKNIEGSFNLVSGIDTCGLCRLMELKKAGIYSLKIVGRNYSTRKKINDVKFLRQAMSFIEKESPDSKELEAFVKKAFQRVYNLKCNNLCYYQ